MACACGHNKTTTTMICNVCNRQMDLRHKKDVNPVEWAIKVNRKCSKCESVDWSIYDSSQPE
jgi:hypothetical protein